MIYLIEFGLTSDYNAFFAYMSAVPAANLLVELLIIGISGCKHGGIENKWLYYTLVILMWLIVLINGAFNGYSAY